MERYDSYKDSGVDWLGQIPSHWEVKPGFTCFHENKERNRKLSEKVVLSLSYGRIVVKPEEKMTGLVPESFEGYQLISPGDIVIRTTDLQNDHTSLRVGIARDKGMITSAYLGLKCAPTMNPDFIYRLLACFDAMKVFYGMGSGLRQNIDFRDFKWLGIAMPPREEQDRIVAFLDEKTAEIDAAIAKKKLLIELLQEQKSILINQAVTRGLNPDAPLRDSGVEWIGQIPAHWDVRKVAHTFRSIGSGTTPPSGDVRYYENGTIDWINTGDLTDWDIVDETKKLTPLALRRHSTLKIYPKGTLIVAMYGATIGKTGISTAPATVNQACCCLNGSDAITSRYAQLWFFGYKREIVSMGYGGGQPNISQEVIRSLRIPVPPVDEQTEIVSHIESSMTKIDRVIEMTRVALSQLNEVKSSLIASAVTGKIKV